MRLKSVSKIKTRFQKLVLYSQEEVKLTDHLAVNPQDIRVLKDPFPHLVVENFFKESAYRALCEEFDEAKARGLSTNKKDFSKFHFFEMDYDGYLYLPQASLQKNNPLSIFFSLEWNNFFSHLFKQFTTFETTFAFHHHPIGDRTGFIHNDYTLMPFSSFKRLPNGVIYSDGIPSNMHARRIISILFYLNNDGWKEGDGGETGIYSADQKTLLKVVPPINNTLFAFQTSPHSMHAFQTNRTERNSMIQWFHISPELL